MFNTSDLGLASALVSAGIRLSDLDKSNPRRVEFIFEGTDEVLQLVDDYWANNLRVSPLTYFNSMKMLKNRIYSS